MFAVLFAVFFAGVSAGADAVDPTEALRLSLFGKSAGERQCLMVSRGLKNQLKEKSPEVNAVVESILQALRTTDVAALRKLFHPRLEVSTRAINRTFNQLRSISRPPFDFSVHRVWALNTVDGDPKILNCENDDLALGPQYGYDLQFGVWLQVMASKELTRIYTSIVPVKGEWKLGAWHLQQWTHQGKDAEAWIKEAQVDAEQGRKLAAYTKLDLVTKLIDGAAYVYPHLSGRIQQGMRSLYAEGEWQKEISKALGKWEVVYTGSLFAKDGAGIIVRTLVDKDADREVLRKNCMEMAKALGALTKDSELGGIRCSYVTKGEPIEKEGFLGGRFMARKEFMEKTP